MQVQLSWESGGSCQLFEIMSKEHQLAFTGICAIEYRQRFPTIPLVCNFQLTGHNPQSAEAKSGALKTHCFGDFRTAYTIWRAGRQCRELCRRFWYGDLWSQRGRASPAPDNEFGLNFCQRRSLSNGSCAGIRRRPRNEDSVHRQIDLCFGNQQPTLTGMVTDETN